MRRTILGCLAAALLLGACSSGDDDSSSGGSSTTEATATNQTVTTGGGSNPFGGGEGEGGEGEGEGGAPADPDSLTGTWEGTYECSQGETDLRLTIDDRGEEVEGAFEFVPPGAGADRGGSYSLVGNEAEGVLVLEGHQWLPDGRVRGYSMVGLRAELGERTDTETLSGTVVGSGCSTFSVERTSTDPWYVGKWRGGYGCNQGLTGLTLTIAAAGEGQVSAVFEFYAHPDNPGVPSGSYRMAGTYEDGRLALEGTEWIEQPPGYVMVGYEGWSDGGVDPNRIYGTVSGAGCSVFEMRRVRD
jgi:hypothetical protein